MLGARLESGRSRYEPGLRWVLSGSSRTSDLNIGIPVAPLPGAWCYRVRPGTGRPGDSIMRLGEMESFDLQLLSQCGST